LKNELSTQAYSGNSKITVFPTGCSSPQETVEDTLSN